MSGRSNQFDCDVEKGQKGACNEHEASPMGAHRAPGHAHATTRIDEGLRSVPSTTVGRIWYPKENDINKATISSQTMFMKEPPRSETVAVSDEGASSSHQGMFTRKSPRVALKSIEDREEKLCRKLEAAQLHPKHPKGGNGDKPQDKNDMPPRYDGTLSRTRSEADMITTQRRTENTAQSIDSMQHEKRIARASASSHGIPRPPIARAVSARESHKETIGRKLNSVEQEKRVARAAAREVVIPRPVVKRSSSRSTNQSFEGRKQETVLSRSKSNDNKKLAPVSPASNRIPRAPLYRMESRDLNSRAVQQQDNVARKLGRSSSSISQGQEEDRRTISSAKNAMSSSSHGRLESMLREKSRAFDPSGHTSKCRVVPRVPSSRGGGIRQSPSTEQFDTKADTVDQNLKEMSSPTSLTSNLSSADISAEERQNSELIRIVQRERKAGSTAPILPSKVVQRSSIHAGKDRLELATSSHHTQRHSDDDSIATLAEKRLPTVVTRQTSEYSQAVSVASSSSAVGIGIPVGSESCDGKDCSKARHTTLQSERLEQEHLKQLEQQQSTVSLASFESSLDNPTSLLSLVEGSSEKRQMLPQLASPVANNISLHGESNQDRPTPPPAFPGAFAIIGMDATDDSEGGHSDFTSEGNTEGSPSSDAGDIEASGVALEAHLAEDGVLVEGAVVADEIELDPKVARRLRIIQCSTLLFSLAAVSTVLGGVLGHFSKQVNEESVPQIEGWELLGGQIRGPALVDGTYFGSSIVLSGTGNRILISAPGVDNDSNLNVGALYLYEEGHESNGTTWTLVEPQLFGNNAGQTPDSSVAASSNLDRFVVGYPYQGSGHVMTYTGQLAQSQLKFEKDDAEAWFGFSTAMSNTGRSIAIGSPRASSEAGDQVGMVQIFESFGDNWTVLEELHGGVENEFFGWSLAMARNGNRLAVGCPHSLDSTGTVRVFDKIANGWSQTGDAITGLIPGNRFGESLDFSDDGSVLAVGARGLAFDTPGYTVVFRDDLNEWLQMGKMLEGQAGGEGFGSAVALSHDGQRVAVGAPQSNLFGAESGKIEVFDFDATNNLWTRHGSSLGGSYGYAFGSSVALSYNGSVVAGGGPQASYDDRVARSGAVLIFSALEAS